MMPVTIKPAPHGANTWNSWAKPAASAEELLRGSCPTEHQKCQSIIQSSFQTLESGPAIYPSTNGFVQGAISAYNQHHHLIIRPEDVWFSILAQFNIFMSAHSEELRELFVAHEGRKELEIKEPGSLYTVHFGQLAQRMGYLISENVLDPTLRDWVMPSFTTTTPIDEIVASVMMMGALQQYFSYKVTLTCGLPSVTLLGTKEDWEDVYNRLDILPRYGTEPSQWHSLLKPVIARFVESFESPGSPEIKDFWQTIAHYSSGGSGPTWLSGWITAFCFWDADGKSLFDRDWAMKGPMDHMNPRTCLNGTFYHRIDSDDVPPGFASVPVKVDDNGRLYDTIMVAGSIGMRVTSSGGMSMPQNSSPSLGHDEAGGRMALDTVQPESGWWIFDKKSESELIDVAGKRASIWKNR